MRILHVAHGWPPEDVGGTELYTRALLLAQQSLGHDVSHWVPRLERPLRFEHTFARPEADAAFLARCREVRPDVVHIHHLSGASLDIPAQSPAPVVFTLHDAWLACARGQLVDLAGERCLGPDDSRCARCLAPALWAPVPDRIATRLPARTGVIRARREALARLIVHVDRFLTPSAHLAARLGIPALHLPLPLVRPIAPAPAGGHGPVRFLYLGAMIPTKGPHLALEAFGHLPAGSAMLTLVGPTPAYNGTSAYVNRLRIRAHELPGVTMTGQVAPEAVEDVLHGHDVLLFPSTWDENSPLTLREAAAAGLRIIASDIPGVSEVLGDAGARFELGSARSLQRAMAAEIAVGRARAPIPADLGLAEHTARILAVYAALPPRAR